MIRRIAVHGAAGRMGRRVIALAAEAPAEFAVTAALEAPGHQRLGEDAGLLAGVGRLGVPLSAQLLGEADVLIDFSLPEATERLLDVCRAAKIPLVSGTTGLNDAQTAKFRAAAEEIPVLWAANMSVAVNLALKLAEKAAVALKERDADVEIIERHHRFKQDAPSGTALHFGRLIAGVLGGMVQRHGREGLCGPRPRNEIGFHAVRAGDNAGEHTVLFGMLGESLELTVRVANRDSYAAGALAAAKFLAGKPPGWYDMNHVLGL